MLWRGREDRRRENEADRMARPVLPEVANDTSPRLRDMVLVPVKPNEGAFESIKSQKATTARDTESGAILVSGVSANTDGEVGATQRIKIVKKGYQIFDNLTGASVFGPADVSTIWAGFVGSCATGGAGDAVVLYDKAVDRWVISQFASAAGRKTVTEECFAVSTTSDATGSYHRYAFHLGANFIDSPHLSVRPDGYLMGDSVFNESATERLGNQFFLFDRTAMLIGAAATFTTPGVDTRVGETYSISAHSVRVRPSAQLRSAPSIVPAVSTLTINLTYDPDSTFTSAGLSAADITAMKAANTFAALQFTNSFTDPINVNISVTAVPGTGTLGGSSSSVFFQPFATGIRDPTRADATTPDDATMAGAGGSVPAGLADPIGGTHNWFVTRAQRKALSIAADDLTQDGTYTFGGGFTYTYDPNNRAVAGAIDYIGVSMHEFSEIMGRLFGLGRLISGAPAYSQTDLFHFTAANTRGLTNGGGRFFSFDNGTSLLKAFNNAAANGGDAQDWASGTNDCFNAFSSSGVKNDLTAVDIRVMDVIGFNFVTGSLRIDTISPPAGRTSGNQPIRLTGAFAGLSTVTMGGVSASWVYTNGGGDTTAITVTTPAHAVGAVQIELTPTAGTPYSKPNAFAYLPTVFTDDTILVGQTTAKAQHITELRQAVDAMRAVAGLSGAPWTDPALAAGDTIKAAHILDLRTFLDDAATRLGYSTSAYTDPSLSAGFLIKRVHIEELRERIRTIAG